MNTTIDSKVVEMRFDNSNFEKNAAASLSTLEKLKQKLNLTGASKGLENLNSAANKVNLSGLGSAVETVQAKFSALDVIGVTALANITNQAVNAGKRIVSALTIDPVKTGFQEYETQINAVQTILANTQSKGSTIDDVNKALDELNKYADLTIYNFTEMTRNIGTFTAAGIDLETSVSAIQGIANLAAVSGSTSQQASTAMYQLSQALAAGTVKLMDWNSVVNAGMGGEVFQNALKKTSELLGTGAEAAIKAKGSFRESLSAGWLTSEVLTETLKKFTTSGANEYVAEYTGLSKEAVEASLKEAKAKYGEAEAIEYASKALAEKSGKNADEIKSVLEMANTATDAATKVKTFSQLWDVLKEAAQSGWSKTWQLIIGDFEEAKSLLTPLSDTLTEFINKMSDWRNNILQGALDFKSVWDGITEKLDAAGFGKVKEVAETFDNITDKVEDAADKLKYFQDIVDKVWRGDYGNHTNNAETDRFALLKAAGYDDRVVQDLVNKGYQYKLTIEDVEASHKKFGLTMETTTEETKKTASAFVELTDKQLEQAGLTEDEISLYRALEKEAKRLGISVSDLAEEMSETDGRTLLIDSFKNAADGIVGIGKAIKSAWVDIFNPPGVGELAIKLYGALKSLNQFSEKLRLTDKDTGELNETGKKLQRTFKGIFAVVDIVTTILGGGLKVAFKVLTSVLGYFHLDILDVTAAIGDALVKFRDWFDSLFDISAVLDIIVPLIKSGSKMVAGWVGAIKDWIKAFFGLPEVQEALERFNAALEKLQKGFGPALKAKIETIKEWIDAFKNIPEVQKAMESFANALDKIQSIDVGASIRKMINSFMNLPLVQKLLAQFGTSLDDLKNTDLRSVGKNIIDGLLEGINNGVKKVVVGIINLGTKIIEGICDILGIHSPSTVFMAIGGFIVAGLILGIKEGFVTVPEALQGIVDRCIDIIQQIDWGTVIAAGITIAGLVFVKKIGDALESFAAPFEGLGNILSETSKVIASFGKVTKAIAFETRTKGIKNLAVSLLILVGAVALLTRLDIKEMWNAVGVITVLAVILGGLAWAIGKMSDASISIGKEGPKISGIVTGLIPLGLALLALAAIVKIIGSMEPEEAKQGFITLSGMMAAMLVFLGVTRKIVSNKAAKNISEIGKLMTKIAIAMLLMVIVTKLAGNLSEDEINQGTRFIIGLGVFVAALAIISKSGAKQHISNVGGMLIKMAVAMGLMVVVCKLAGHLSAEEILKGIGFAAAFTLFVKGLVKVTSVDKGTEIAKLSGLLLSISLSMVMMVGICKLVNKLSTEEMLKGAAFAAAFILFVKGLVKVTSVGSDTQIAKVAGTIIALSFALGVLAAVSMMLSILSLEQLAKGVGAMAILGSIMALMIHATRGVENVKGTMTAMAVAIGILAVAVVALSFIEPDKLAGSVAAISIVLGMFALVLKSSKNVTGSMGTIITLTVAVAMLAGIIWALSALDVQASLTNAAALSLLLTSMSACMWVLSKTDISMSNIKDVAAGIIALTAMALPLLTFIFVMKQMNGMEDATSNVIALTALVTAMTLLLVPLTLLGSFAKVGSIATGIIALTAMAIPLYAFIWTLKQMNGIEDASEKIKSLVVAMTAMTLLLGVLTIIGKFGGFVAAVAGIGSLVVLFAAIGGLAVGIGYLMDQFPNIQKFLDIGLPVLEQLAGSIGAMIGKFIGGIGEGLSDSLVKMSQDLELSMSYLSKASENASGIKSGSFDGVKDLMGVMADIALTTVGTTIGDIFTLGGTSMEKFQKDGVAFFEAMKAIGEASSDITINEESMKSVIGVAQSLADLQSSLEPIGGVISWFTGRDDLGTFGKNAAQFMVSMKGAFGELDGAEFNTQAMDSIVFAATSLADLQHNLEPIGGVVTWFTGRDDLGKFGVNVRSFVRSIATAFSDLDGSEFNTQAMDSIISAATSLADLQSSLEPIGGVISWFKGRDDLGTFGVNIGTFISSIKTAFLSLDGVEFNTEAMNSIVSATTSLAGLQASLEPIGGVITWFTGRNDLGTFGVNVGTFISSMKTAMMSLEGTELNTAAMDSIISAATSLAGLQASLEPMGGVVSWFTGRDDLGAFGTNIGLFADAMAKLKTGIGEDGISEDVVTSVINAGNAIIELQKALPTEGWFDGKMNLTEFSNYVTDFSTAMSKFSSTASTIDSGAVSTVISTAYQIKGLINSLVDLDTSGLTTFTGVGTGGFGADGAAYKIAQAIAAYSKKVADINTTAVSVSVSAAQKLKSLIASLVGLDTSGIENFKPQSIGTAMKKYADKVVGIDTEAVSVSVTSAQKLKSLIASLVGLDTSGIANFNPQSIGSALKSYADKVIEIDAGAISASITSAARLRMFISSLAGMDTSGVVAFKTAISSLASTDMGGFAEAFGDSSKFNSFGINIVTGIVNGIKLSNPLIRTASIQIVNTINTTISSKKQTFNQLGIMLMNVFINGIRSRTSNVRAAAASCCGAAISAIRGYRGSFYSAGSYLVDGLAAGISENSYKAVAKARAMASAAAQAARDELDINSPSKVFRAIGYSVPEGFAMGIDRMTRMVKVSSVAMADIAVDSVNNTVSKLAAAINTDIDSEPTIRPVLDLDNIKSGAASIGELFNGGVSVATLSNVGAINATMNRKNQNGVNGELISAIDKLRGDLNKVGNTYYTVDGITYSNGTEVADAISSLTRAIKMEGRI